jgi:hypothetical protein
VVFSGPRDDLPKTGRETGKPRPVEHPRKAARAPAEAPQPPGFICSLATENGAQDQQQTENVAEPHATMVIIWVVAHHRLQSPARAYAARPRTPPPSGGGGLSFALSTRWQWRRSGSARPLPPHNGGGTGTRGGRPGGAVTGPVREELCPMGRRGRPRGATPRSEPLFWLWAATPALPNNAVRQITK